MEWIGTSGFQYPEWKGKFYPEKIKPSEMLGFYSKEFSSTEVNYTFKRIPSQKTIETWRAGTPSDFRFSFKAPERITHFARLVNCGEVLSVFAEAIKPMEKKLGIVLFQLPPNFKKDASRLRDFVQAVPAPVKGAFEFRNVTWFDDETYTILRDHGMALCLAEDENLATPREATTDFGYLRLRREDYTPEQLRSWAEFARVQKWKETYAYFKHEERAVGPKFAQEFKKLVRES